MRIADILREPEDEQCCGHSAAASSSSRTEGRRSRRKRVPSRSSPRCLLSRWLPSTDFLKCRSFVEEYDDEEASAEEDGVEAVCVPSQGSTRGPGPGLLVSADGQQEGTPNSEATAPSGGGALAPVGSEERRMSGSVWKPEQTYLNIGMGAGLLFLLTRSMSEFNKMAELRKEVEVLLKEIKAAMQRKDTSPSSDESKNNLTFCGSDSWADTEQSNDLSMQDCDLCLELGETSCDAELENRWKFSNDYDYTKSPGIDRMEAELESELELLQLNLYKQDSSEQRGREISGERSGPSESFSVSLGEHLEPKEQAEEEDTMDQYGVCPHELRRRLHELLEARQQERISELESALELAHVKLHEKEMEICWWRDATQLVSQNKQETLLG